MTKPTFDAELDLIKTCFCNTTDHEICWDGQAGIFDPKCSCCRNTARDLSVIDTFENLPAPKQGTREDREKAFFEILCDLEAVIEENGYAEARDFTRASEALKKARAEWK